MKKCRGITRKSEGRQGKRDFNNQVGMQYGIRGIPALLVFKGGSVANQIVGAVPKKNNSNSR
ncbi:MAG: hypothetical protein Ct9H300mP29_8480 [Candidatus Neomarinimicrobiota bacterium]|nr:MAG: hypothetical protein Ct9H300mP29_8480 [Candidatus Neomarinimicrobiota bacterium]